jgi:NAD(P)-dependent dehydrogenase (short-subunit alcohol dehydrogenase family)
MNGLRGKVVFVTGAGSGTGRAVALSLARQGAHIAAWVLLVNNILKN